MEEGHQDLEDSWKLSGDLGWIFNQDCFQQAYYSLHLHIQLMTNINKLQPTVETLFFPTAGFIAYPLKFLAKSSLLFQLALHHFLLFARELHLLFDAFFLLQFLQNKKEIENVQKYPD